MNSNIIYYANRELYGTKYHVLFSITILSKHNRQYLGEA